MPPVTLLESMPDFKRAIAQNKLSVVDFFAVWCGPCKAISPRFEKMAQDNTNAGFYKVNVDNLPDVAREYGVTAMPTFKLFKSGKLVDTIVGANVNALESKIKQHSTPAAFGGTGRTLGSGGGSSSSPTSPTSPTSASPTSPAASASTSAFAAFKSSPDNSPPAAAVAHAHTNSNSTFVWIAVVFLLVYWYFGQRGGVGKEGMADVGYEF